MMSDPALRGKVTWLLMTARIERLSPDIRRPGRVGDLIVPVLDPEGDDRAAFVRWMVSAVVPAESGRRGGGGRRADDGRLLGGVVRVAPLDAQGAGVAGGGRARWTWRQIRAVLHDHLPPDIGPTRRYQTLQALVNCTRRSLLPDPDVTEATREGLAGGAAAAGGGGGEMGGARPNSPSRKPARRPHEARP